MYVLSVALKSILSKVRNIVIVFFFYFFQLWSPDRFILAYRIKSMCHHSYI